MFSRWVTTRLPNLTGLLDLIYLNFPDLEDILYWAIWVIISVCAVMVGVQIIQ